ncbi:hypothetical protein [Synechococcus sp. PCC 7336]|uniref:hypothetical protein n=1 Tax=Synechococcus sp. PCC 7336 TaxID=195250 RepID=UPI000362055D|nr:hypothetical protein [Synechococcus sp. PCC 7336]
MTAPPPIDWAAIGVASFNVFLFAILLKILGIVRRLPQKLRGATQFFQRQYEALATGSLARSPAKLDRLNQSLYNSRFGWERLTGRVSALASLRRLGLWLRRCSRRR